MNKKIFILLFIVFIALIATVYFLKINQKDSHDCLFNKGYSWCDFKQKCIKQEEEDCSLTQDWILNEAKKIIGLNLNLIPNEIIKWKTGDGEIAFSVKGIYYSDLLKAEKIIRGFEDWDKFLNEIGLRNDHNNPVTISDKENIIRYSKEKIICELKRTDNSNNTSSLSLFCGNTNDKLCSFGSDCGRECSSDSDCDLIVDGCQKIIVCRARGYKFYHDCQNPTSNVDELDLSINQCECLNNRCIPKDEKLRDKN